ncbi:MAG: GspE/PulE family protein [Candidatus Dormibacteraeota bacterium]|nr:GspE/PulE family protein [Candidatus Dormibacteraeota bacterium]
MPGPRPATRPPPAPAGPTVELSSTASEKEALALVPESFASAHLVLPLTISAGTLRVACADPEDLRMLGELQVLARLPVVATFAPQAEIEESIRQRYKVLGNVDQHVREFTQRMPIVDADGALSLKSIDASSPVVQIVNLLITQGLRDRASDIHIEPQRTGLRVRFRIDGLLTDAITLPKAMGPSLASRIKVMANMDIVDKHRAQDGQIRIEGAGRQVDIRVSTAETIWGEKLVLRLLDQGRTLLRLDQLGLELSGIERMSRLLSSPYGMVVVSGPTGSGKTTTLYAAINELDPIAQNITTIEDPVEYTFDNINQIQIRKVANIDFANGLKAILRQDPDVILVGEIRDIETAEIAVQSALTGHLVLTSIHATDAAGATQRFIEMGIEGFLISSALIGVGAQRLLRRVCTYCKTRYRPSPDEMLLWEEFGARSKAEFFHGGGCANCAGTGYRGRIGVFEVLELTDPIKRLVSARASAQDIREKAQRDGMVTLRQDAVAKVAADVTTLSEVIRCVWLN